MSSYSEKVLSRELDSLSKEYSRIVSSIENKNVDSNKQALDQIKAYMIELESDMNSLKEINFTFSTAF